MIALALMALCSVPLDLTIEDRVECIHINHFYDSEGREIFVQVIFEDWPPENIVAWRLYKKPCQLPVWNQSTGEYVATWFDGNYMRRVVAPLYRETWTQFDPELDARRYWKSEHRRGLTKPFVMTEPSGIRPDDLDWGE